MDLAIASLLEDKPAAALVEVKGLEKYDRLMVIAMAEHDLGHAEEAQRALDERISKQAHNGAVTIAQVLAWWGDRDRAFEWLERGRNQQQGLNLIKGDVCLRKLHDDPRWAALLRRMKLPPDP